MIERKLESLFKPYIYLLKKKRKASHKNGRHPEAIPIKVIQLL
jgi:hypothetical protein